MRWRRGDRWECGRHSRVQGLRVLPCSALRAPLPSPAPQQAHSSPGLSGLSRAGSVPALGGVHGSEFPLHFPPGTESYHSQPCPVGHYCPAGTRSPRPCPLGAFRSSRQAGAVEECLPCPAGSFSAQPGQAGCLPCGSSAFSPPGESHVPTRPSWLVALVCRRGLQIHQFPCPCSFEGQRCKVDGSHLIVEGRCFPRAAVHPSVGCMGEMRVWVVTSTRRPGSTWDTLREAEQTAPRTRLGAGTPPGIAQRGSGAAALKSPKGSGAEL